MKKMLLVLGLIMVSTLIFAQNKNYVVVFKDSFEAPIRKNQIRNPNRGQQANSNASSRNQKIAKLDQFLRQRNIPEGQAKKFVDGAVGFIASLNSNEVSNLRNDPNVQSVVEDFQMQSRPRMQGSRPRMQGENFGDWLYDPAIKASCAIPLMGGSLTGSSRSSIWIIDSGVEGTHTDLNVSTNPNFSASFISGESPLEDFAGHGTHCAGLAAGMGQGNPGVTGMSPGAEIIPIKVLDRNGSGNWSDLVLALDHVEKFGVAGDVVMMSLGASEVMDCENSEPFLRDIILDLGNKGVFVVMSAGNETAFANSNLPGCINGPNVVTVASVDFSCGEIGGFSAFSNMGIPPIDWVAPGNALVSTFPRNSYNVMSGTSMAGALVAGLIHSKGGLPNRGVSVQFGGVTYFVAGR
jgi:subtilisin family serine protease